MTMFRHTLNTLRLYAVYTLVLASASPPATAAGTSFMTSPVAATVSSSIAQARTRRAQPLCVNAAVHLHLLSVSGDEASKQSATQRGRDLEARCSRRDVTDMSLWDMSNETSLDGMFVKTSRYAHAAPPFKLWNLQTLPHMRSRNHPTACLVPPEKTQETILFWQ